MKGKIKKTALLVKWSIVSALTFALWTGCSAEPKQNADAGNGPHAKAGQTIDTNSQAASKPQKRENIKVTFVELGSVRCIPCKMMQPIMADIEKEYAGQVKVVFHDVWTPEGRPAAEKYGIQAIPTQVFLDSEGKEYFRHAGFFPKEELVKVLQQKGVK